jgi:cobalt/nickel transport system permease protein
LHISEGILSGPVLAGGAALAAAGVAVGLRKIDYESVPRIAVVSSALFVASLIHVPIGPTSVHLVLNGLARVVLGWAAVPAILVALLLQAVLFSHGGLTVLGVNTVVMAAPAVACHYLFGGALRRSGRTMALTMGFLAGLAGIVLGCLVQGAALWLTRGEFLAVVAVTSAAHVPVGIIEGLVTASTVAFLRKVRPELLTPPSPAIDAERTSYDG